jgi:hypothetical protein
MYASASFYSIRALLSIISFRLVQDKSEHLHHHATDVMTTTARAATLYFNCRRAIDSMLSTGRRFH